MIEVLKDKVQADETEKQVWTTNEYSRNENQATNVLVPSYPIDTSAHELNAIIDCPEQLFHTTPLTPALLISQDHRLLRAKVSLIMRKQVDVFIQRVDQDLEILKHGL